MEGEGINRLEESRAPPKVTFGAHQCIARVQRIQSCKTQNIPKSPHLRKMDEKLIKQTFDAGMKRNRVQHVGVGGKVWAGALTAGGGVFHHPSCLKETVQGGLPGSPPPARLPMWHGWWAERPGWAGAGAGQGGGDSGAQLAGKPQPGLEFASESSIQK